MVAVKDAVEVGKNVVVDPGGLPVSRAVVLLLTIGVVGVALDVLDAAISCLATEEASWETSTSLFALRYLLIHRFPAR